MNKVSVKPLFTLNFSLVLGVVGVYFLNNLWLKKMWENVILKDYLNDFLFIIILNSVCFLILASLFSKRVNWFRIFALNYIITCIIFELIVPNFSKNATGDIFDCIAYFCGLLVHLILFKIYDTHDLRKTGRRKTSNADR